MFTMIDMLKVKATAQALILIRQQEAEDNDLPISHESVEYYTQGVLDLLHMLKNTRFEGTSPDFWDAWLEKRKKEGK